MEKFGEYVKNLRLKLGLGLREVARSIDIEPSYLSDIERSRRNAPTTEKLEKLASALSLSEAERPYFYDLAKVGKQVEIAEDVQNIITENEKMPALCRKIKEKNIDVDALLRRLERK